jgi:serum/glucocorticoid-regulated kinase 2
MKHSHCFSGYVKKKGSRFGFWHTRFCTIEGSDLILKKKEKNVDIERRLTLRADTRIDIVPDSDEKQIIIQPIGDKPLILKSKKKQVYTMLNAFREVTLCSPHITMNSFQIKCVIGRGQYGKVMLCKRINSENLYAIKVVKKSKLVKFNRIRTIFSEKYTLMRAKHPFIVEFYFAFQSRGKLYLGLEYVPGGELNNHLREVGRIPMGDVRIYIAELALAINYLHSIGVIYRDLKPENILIASDGHLKMTDFGLSKVSVPDDLTSTFCGTSEYISPEMINQRCYNGSVDWWSLGILAYELATGLTPFVKESRVNTFKAIATENITFAYDLPEDFKSLVTGLLKKDPKERFTFEDIKKHEFFRGINWNSVYEKEYAPDYVPKIRNDLSPVPSTGNLIGYECPADSLSAPVDVDQEMFEGFSCVINVNENE